MAVAGSKQLGPIKTPEDWRGLMAGFVLVGSLGLVTYSMAAGKEIPQVFLGALSSAWGAVIAWYFFRKGSEQG